MLRLFLSLIVAASLWTAGPGPVAAAEWNKLVGASELSALATAGGVTVLDIRAPEDYAAGHVAGALSAPYGSWRGPQDNPGLELTDAALTERLQSLGLTPDSAVVITYQGKDSTDFGAAARVYWTLKSAGLSRIAILNGGLAAWAASGQALSTDPATAARSTASFALAKDWMIDREGIAAVLKGERQSTVIDARPAAFYKGEKQHPAASRPGTLPTALSLPQDTWFNQSPTEIATAEKVAELAKAAGYSAESGTELVSFCNTGHWAATNWFALSEVAGIEGVKLYPESMVGWTNSGGAVTNGQ